MSSTTSVERAYNSLRPDIESVCRSFALRRGLDPEEITSEGNLHFMRAYRRHRKARDPRPFDRYAKYFVKRQLLETARLNARRERLLPRVPLEDCPCPEPKFDLRRFLTDLGGDAAEVVGVLFHTGFGRRRLRDHFRLRGWGWERVKATFQEIGEALS